MSVTTVVTTYVFDMHFREQSVTRIAYVCLQLVCHY